MDAPGEEIHWYALKVFFNKVFDVEKQVSRDGVESYIPCETVTVLRNGIKKTVRRTLVSSLMFVRSSQSYAVALQATLPGRAMLYTHLDREGRRVPSAISDYEIFSHAGPAFCVGQRVRVIDGPFKGAEGYIRRIKGKRRLIVAISGVCAVATSFIPNCFLQKLEA